MVDSDSDQFSVQRRLHHAKQVQHVVLCACHDRMLFLFRTDSQKFAKLHLEKCSHWIEITGQMALMSNNFDLTPI